MLEDNLASWLSRMMAARGLKQREVAEALGVSGPLVSRWVNGHTRRPDAEQVQGLAKLFRVPVEEVARVTGQALVSVTTLPERRPLDEELRDLTARLLPLAERNEELVLVDSKTILAPVYDVEAAADVRRIVLTEGGVVETIPVPREAARQGGRLFVIRARGGCLEPTVPDGGHVVVERGADYAPGDVVLAERGGGLHLKEVRRDGNGPLVLAGKSGPELPLDELTTVYGVARFVLTPLGRGGR